MPQLNVKGISAESMRTISTALIDDLASICECGTDNFTIDCLQTTSVFGGETVQTFPFIEVAWFERGQDTRDRVAAAMTKHVLSLGVAEVEIAFVVYQEDSYYANGKRFGRG